MHQRCANVFHPGRKLGNVNVEYSSMTLILVIGISWSDGSSSVVLALSWQMTATIRYTCPFEGTIEFVSVHAQCQCPERGLQEQLFLQLFLLQNSQWKERVLPRSFSQNIVHTASYKMSWGTKTKTHGKLTSSFGAFRIPIAAKYLSYSDGP